MMQLSRGDVDVHIARMVEVSRGDLSSADALDSPERPVALSGIGHDGPPAGRQRPWSSIAGLALAVTLSACASSLPGGATSPVAFDRGTALASVNAFRSEHGLSPLRLDGQLTVVAQSQSTAMAARDRMDHDVDGALPSRMSKAGYRWSTTAENIGRGYRSYDAAMDGWVHSPGHRANLLNPRVTEIGLGAARGVDGGRNYWTQVFAAPKQPPRTGAPPARTSPAG